MSRLERKLGRDALRLKGQIATIALVLGCGVMALLMVRGTYDSLLIARDRYYADARMADVFAHLERAPDPVAARLERIPGVASVHVRVVKDVMVPIEDEDDPVPGRIVSIPADGAPPLNALHLRRGRMPAPGVPDEAVVLEQFAVAHELSPGDSVPAVLNGRLRRLSIVGIALSPEYVLAVAPGDPMPDERRYVVFWMLRETIAPVFRLEGAFNDVVLDLQEGARLDGVLAAVDRELAPWGGFHAIGRDKQASSLALQGELDNLGNLAVSVPLAFLGVAAFLVNVVISRLVFLERTQIAVLKALGIGNRRIALHYLELVGIVVAVGCLLGLGLGVWSGRWMTGMYGGFYRFPATTYQLTPALLGLALAVGALAAATGALVALVRVVRLPPAQAMQPAAPLRYRRTILERLGVGAVLGPAPMMAFREIQRRPLRFLLSTAGIAFGVGIYVMGRFSWDSFDHYFAEVFLRENRADMVVSFVSPRPVEAIHELEALPGVLRAERQRIVPVRFRAGGRWRDSFVLGLERRSELRHVIHALETEIVPPPDGIVMTDVLAEALGVEVGERVEVELLEGAWPTRSVAVVGLVNEPFGMQAYAEAGVLDALLREEPRATSALLRVDPALAGDVRARLKAMPAVMSATEIGRIVDNYDKQMRETTSIVTLILTLSAAAIAIGIVYNNARIALSVRSRELASLRVLGFTRAEISSVLLGELGAQVALGIPLGLLLGRAWAGLMAAGIESEVIRFPLHMADTTYGMAAFIALLSGVVSALLVRRKLDTLDLVSVLKAAE